MYLKKYLLLVLGFVMWFSGLGQMIVGKDTLFGNEWIKKDKEYYKFPVSEDGLYRIYYGDLLNAGFPLTAVEGKYLQIFCLGKEIPFYSTNPGQLSNGDYLEFYGKRNRSEIDRFLFDDPDKNMLNPDYSLFNDTISCYISWSDSISKYRINLIKNDTSKIIVAEMSYEFHQLFSFTGNRNKPVNFINEYNSRFDSGEGYGSAISKSFSMPFSLASMNDLKDSIKIEIRFYTLPNTHNIECRINGNLITNILSEGAEVINRSISIPKSFLSASNTIELIEVDATSSGFNVATIKLNYSKIFSPPYANIFQLEIDTSIFDQKIELEDYDSQGQAVFLFDLEAQIKIAAIQKGSLTIFNLPAYSGKRRIIISRESDIKSIKQIEKVQFRDFSEENADYIIISHKSLFDDGSGNNIVKNYGDYRQSKKGGSHQISIIDIQELYDQFGYGNNRNMICIRNFAHYIKKNWPLANSIFLIGKGREYPELRSPVALSNSVNQSFYIPVFGSPGSDNLFVISQGQRTPSLSIGRIAAENPTDVKNYLDKIRDFELKDSIQQNIEDQFWKKEIIHLGGGNTKPLQDALKNLLVGMQTEIESNRFGAHVSTYSKSSTDPIQVSQNQQIFNRINKGVSIITFLGHSAVGTFDFSIDNPQNYKNYRKYPLMFSLGCYSGNYNTSTKGIGENFCFYKDKGALGFVATSYVGLPSVLSEFTTAFYNQLGGKSFSKSVGEVLKETYADLNKNQDEYYRLITEQMSYHGDPAFTIQSQVGSDFTLDINSLQLSPSNINIQIDSFLMELDVINLGESIKDTLDIEIQVQLPGGEIKTIKNIKIKAPSNKIGLSTYIPIFGKESFGKNILFIKLDPENKIEELPGTVAENNNELEHLKNEKGYEFYINDDIAIPVRPPEFSIVNYSEVILSASTADAFAKEKTYNFELDTIASFNSPAILTTTLKSRGGLLNWKPNYSFIDSTVYYWRVSIDTSKSGLNTQWQSSSFFYQLNSKSGWNQSHYDQFRQDSLINLTIKDNGKLSFVDDVKDIFIQNYLRKSGIYPAYYLNNTLSEINYGNDITAGVYVAVIDNKTGIPWVNPKGGVFGSQTPAGWRDRKAFPFNTTDFTQRESLIHLLKDTIPEGFYVVFFTIQDEINNYKPEEWSLDSLNSEINIFQVLEKEGAKLVRQTIQKTYPYSLVYQKGKGILGEVLADSKNDLANLNTSIAGSWDIGEIKTSLIGPASNWSELKWDNDIQNNDSAKLEVYGYNPNYKKKTLLKENLAISSIDLSFIDPLEFPYLEIKVTLRDSIQKTCPGLKYIRVYYDEVMELAIASDQNFFFHKDTLEQGDVLKINLPVYNISKVSSETVQIKYTLTSPDNSNIVSFGFLPILKPDSFALSEFETNTRYLSGSYTVKIEVNPELKYNELHHFNNYGFLNFNVQADKRNPLLDVSFDGNHIIDGEIVSSKPLINIELIDENQFIPLIDPSVFEVYLKYPNKSNFINIPLSASEIEFLPADLKTGLNKASLIFKPTNLNDGEHQLWVIGKDESGNLSGSIEYKVRFNIVKTRSVSRFLPYPNPFANSVRFNYSITGEASPAHLVIYIYNMSGILVKKLDEKDLGILKIGNHNTEYSWDGSDDYGQILPNGMYIFRLELKDVNGNKWAESINTVDKKIENEFGKLIILR